MSSSIVVSFLRFDTKADCVEVVYFSACDEELAVVKFKFGGKRNALACYSLVVASLLLECALVDGQFFFR